MIAVCLRVVLLMVLVGTGIGRGETPLNEARSTLDKWVETRQLISRTRTDWQSDKEMLEQSIQLLERELKGVEEQISKVGTNNTQAEKERTQTQALLASSSEALGKARSFGSEFELRVSEFIPRLPAPLQDTLKPLVNRIPTNSVSTKMPVTERIQVAVGVLNEVDKFNSGLGIFSEKRANDKGEQMAVETVYIGLGAAYFVNETGTFAGCGSPGATGWEWKNQPELAASVRDVIRIYRNEQPARFVLLPATIK